MTKTEFINELRDKLSGLPKKDIEERLNFYSEMIDDQMEEGISEQDAILSIGNVEEIAEQIISDTPLSKIIKKNATPKRHIKVWEIILLALGSPIWFSLLIAAFAVIFSLYVLLWAVIISFWAVFVSVIASALGGILGGVILAFSKSVLSSIAIIGGGLICFGVSIFLYFGCRAATRGTIWITKKAAIAIKKSFIKKEMA